MYIFRIVSPINKAKTWYRGEFITQTALTDIHATNPPGHPPLGEYAAVAGDTVEYDGYLYSSLKDNNNDTPSVNYVGFPLVSTVDSDFFGKNTWVRTGYSNKVLMLVPESCGITESYGFDISGTLRYPSGVPYVDVNKCLCVLFCGVIGSSIAIKSAQKTGIDVDTYETTVGNPEISALNKAFTLSINDSTSLPFPFSITKSTNSVSTYCSGAYMGSWSYLGITQWTNHKKSNNDYSKQDQDEWGNYSLIKNRAGRTYSADVILKPRKNAVFGDYDYNLQDLCYSVQSLLQSQLGVVNAFYFNNQDVGVPWISQNTDKTNEIVQLNDSDIIVGILKNFKITDMTGNRAILNLTVDSVPNEYKNYTAIAEPLPIAPEVDGLLACTAITSNLEGTTRTIALETMETFPAWLVVSPVNGTYNSAGITIQYSVSGVCTVTINESVSIYGVAVGTSSVTITVPYWAATNTIQNRIITFTVNVM